MLSGAGGCVAIMNLRSHGRQETEDAEQWLAWTSLALYHLLENRRTRRYVLEAAKSFLDDGARAVTPSMLKQVMRPHVDKVDVDWIVAL